MKFESECECETIDSCWEDTDQARADRAFFAWTFNTMAYLRRKSFDVIKYKFFIGFVESIPKQTSMLSLVRFTPKTISNWTKKRVFLLRLIGSWITVYWCSKIASASYIEYETAIAKPMVKSLQIHQMIRLKTIIFHSHKICILIWNVFEARTLSCIIDLAWFMNAKWDSIWFHVTCDLIYLAQHKAFVTDMNANLHWFSSLDLSITLMTATTIS